MIEEDPVRAIGEAIDPLRHDPAAPTRLARQLRLGLLWLGGKISPNRASGVLLAAAAVLGVLAGSLTAADYIIEPTRPFGGDAALGGEVTTTNGSLLSGVLVNLLDGGSDRSNGMGWYFIDHVRSGTHTLQVRESGYKTLTVHLTVRSGESRIVNLRLEEGSGEVSREIGAAEVRVAPRWGIVAAVYLGSFSAALGSVLAFRNRAFRTSVLCAALGVFSVGFGIGTLLSLAALMLLYASKGLQALKEERSLGVDEVRAEPEDGTGGAAPPSVRGSGI